MTARDGTGGGHRGRGPGGLGRRAGQRAGERDGEWRGQHGTARGGGRAEGGRGCLEGPLWPRRRGWHAGGERGLGPAGAEPGARAEVLPETWAEGRG